MTQTPPDSSLSATKAAEATSTTTSHGLPGFADLAEAVDPAIVSIQASTIEKAPHGRDGRGRRGQGQGQGQGIDPFEFFFGPRGRGDRPGAPGGSDDDGGNGGGNGGGAMQPEDYRSEAGGSGFVISRDGLIVTNNHVIEGASEVKVHLGDRDYTAQVKGADAATDIALLKINAGDRLKYLELGDSDRARVGDWVMVVGNPLNLNKTVTTGVISAKGRSIGISQDLSFENFLQTDAAINFGNSGGPLVNLQGQVVGIASAINYGAENIGFAVPVNTLKEILPQLRDKGKVSRGYLGINIQNIDWPHAQAFGLSSTDGALVGEVVAGTPAAEAGVQHGDIITAVDGRHIKTTRDLIDYVSAKGPHATVTLTLLRNGKTIESNVKLGERPALNQQASNDEHQDGNSGISWLGLQYEDISQSVRSSYNLPSNVSGVLVTGVTATSPLYDQAVRPGSIVSEVNGQAVHNVAEFERAVGAAKSKSYLRMYTLRFGRQGQSLPPFFAVVQVP